MHPGARHRRAVDVYAVEAEELPPWRRWSSAAAVASRRLTGQPARIPRWRFLIRSRRTGRVVHRFEEQVDTPRSVRSRLNQDLAKLPLRAFERRWLPPHPSRGIRLP